MAAARKLRRPPLVADPAAAERLAAAATAAGLTIQELAELVWDAGVAPPKAKDGITERYTLEDLGKRLWSVLQTTPRAERVDWFTALAPAQKTALVVVLRDNGYRTEVIARDLGVEQPDIMRIWNAYGSKLGAQVVGLRLDTIAGQLQMASERAQELALEAGDHRAYWTIEKEKIATLQSIGIVEKAIQRVEVSHKIDDQQRAELEEFAKFREKQKVRLGEVEEIKAIEAKVDDVPSEVRNSDEYDDDDE